MKNKKSPIVLITLLVLLIGGMVIISMPKDATQDSQKPITQKEEKSLNAQDTQKSLASQLKKLNSSSIDEGMAAKSGPPIIVEGVRLSSPDAPVAQPKPSGTEAPSLWYNNQAKTRYKKQEAEAMKTPG